MARESSHCDLINTRWQRLASVTVNECSRALQHCCHVLLAVQSTVSQSNERRKLTCLRAVHVLHAFEHVLKFTIVE